jgi:hypothetical protein
VTELKEGAQVGLYVVAELAKREGLQVSLRRSAYGGLLAIVLLPERLLVAGSEAAENTWASLDGRVADAQRTDSRRDHDRPVAPGIVPAASRSAVGVLEPEAGPGWSNDTTGGAVNNARPNSGADRVTRRENTSPSAAVGTASPAPHTVARPPLPHRRPQQHLVPELREDGPAEADGGTTPVRSPDEARNRFARYQQGRNEGRASGRDEKDTDGEQGRNA